MEAAAGGDQCAWNQLIAIYARRVFGLIHSRCRDPELAEEITQSVFVTVATAVADRGYTEQGRFESWLFRVAMNRLRDEMRRRRRHAVPTDPMAFGQVGGPERPDASDAPGADLASLRRALAQLPDADREVIELRHHGQMSFKDMAHLLGEPVGTLLARHHRALRKLRAALESSTVDPGSPGSQGGSRPAERTA